MTTTPTPRQILETLFPHLRVAAAYAHQIQSRIAALPDKAQSGNLFAAALSDADLSIQTLVEVALLGSFPQIRFFGEEHEQTYNTKYFRGIDLGPPGDYLVTLDPIDGTRFYLDGHSNYQIILSVLNWENYEAVLALSPAQNRYYYALRGEGTFTGALPEGLEGQQPLSICPPQQIGSPRRILLGSRMGPLAAKLQDRYEIIDVLTSYSQKRQIPNLNGMLVGDLAGAVLAAGNFIDGAALAFLAQEAGAIVTTFDGAPLPPLHCCEGHYLPGLIVASSDPVHQHLVAALQGFRI